jgi:hypothetical protein
VDLYLYSPNTHPWGGTQFKKPQARLYNLHEMPHFESLHSDMTAVLKVIMLAI